MRGLSLAGMYAALTFATFLSPVVAQQRFPSGKTPQTTSSPESSRPQTSTLTTDQRLAALEERMNTTVALKQEEIDALKDRLDFVYKFAGFVGALGALLILVLTVQDMIQRFREGKRQQGIDVLVTDLMTLQNAAISQQNRLGALQVGAAEKDPAKHLEGVHNVNQVIETVQKTLAFRLEQEEKVGKALQ